MASDKQIQDLVSAFPQIKAIVQRLNGDNGVSGKAVTVANLNLLGQIPAQMRATTAAGSTPTKAEYDLLLGDVRSVYSMLVEISRQLK